MDRAATIWPPVKMKRDEGAVGWKYKLVFYVVIIIEDFFLEVEEEVGVKL